MKALTDLQFGPKQRNEIAAYTLLALLGMRDNDGLLKMMATNTPATDLFAPYWQSGGNAVAFTIERLEARFYCPILVWSASNPDEARVLNFDRFQPLLGSRKQHWGTTTEFLAWKGDDVLVRIFDCGNPSIETVDPNEDIVSYNIRTGKIALVSKQPRKPESGD